MKYVKQLNNQKKDRDGKTLYIILVLIIIILTLIIFWLLMLWRENNKERNLTGNVEILEIDCNCKNKDDTSNSNSEGNSQNNSQNSSSDKNNIPSDNKDTEPVGGEDDIITNDLVVSDSENTWSSSNKLKIFKNPVYEMEEIIAPGSTNAYHFVIKNNGKCDFIYQLKFEENNEFKINMKYRLKKNDKYITSTWVSYDQLKANDFTLGVGDQDDYILEWKWFDNNNDTEIGASVSSSYSLKVDIVGKQGI